MYTDHHDRSLFTDSRKVSMNGTVLRDDPDLPDLEETDVTPVRLSLTSVAQFRDFPCSFLIASNTSPDVPYAAVNRRVVKFDFSRSVNLASSTQSKL